MITFPWRLCVLAVHKLSRRFSQRLPEQPTGPSAEEAEGDGGGDVGPGFGPVVFLDELEGLQTEGGEGGEAAAESGDEEKRGGGFALVDFPEPGRDADDQ